MEENKELTREEKIEAYSAEHERRMNNVKEFETQLTKLKLSLLVMDKEKSQEIDAVLSSLPDMSSKGIVDKILTLPMGKRTQLNENIEKLKLAIENETRRAGEAAGKRKALETQIHNERVVAHAKKVVAKFNEWLESYKNCLMVFNDELSPVVQEGYNLAPDFFKWISDDIGPNRTIKISIESHFRQGENVYMSDIIEKIMNLSDAYGPALLEKEFRGTWPEDATGTFFSQL